MFLSVGKTNATLWTAGGCTKVGSRKHHVWNWKKKYMEKKIGGVKWRAVPAKIDFGARLLSIWHIQVKYGWKREGKPVLRVKLIPSVPSIWNNFNLFSENVSACVSDYLCSCCNYTAPMAPANLTLQHNDLLVIKTLDRQAFHVYANAADSATGGILDLNDIPDCPEGTVEDPGWLRLSLCTQIKSKKPKNWKGQIKNKLTKNVFTIHKQAHCCCCPAVSRLCSG